MGGSDGSGHLEPRREETACQSIRKESRGACSFEVGSTLGEQSVLVRSDNVSLVQYIN